jgi:galactokinase
MSPPSLRDRFAARFGRACEVVARAPGRVNLIGEHTDYNDGFVLPIAIEQCLWAGGAARDDGQARVVSVALEDEFTCALTGPLPNERPAWTNYVLGVAALLRERGARLSGFDLLLEGDLPPGAGLASSAALELSSALALANLVGEPLDSAELIDLCRRAEHEFAGVPCGIMDQTACLLGQEGQALLLDCRSRRIEQVPLALGAHELLVVDSQVRHELSSRAYARRQAECREALAYFRGLNPRVTALRDVAVETVRSHALELPPVAAARAVHVTSEIQRTLEAAAALRRGDLLRFGELLRQSHHSLREDYEVSCPELDVIVDVLHGVEGVLGARMTGAGFGGCVVALARRGVMPRVEEAVWQSFIDRRWRPPTVRTVRAGRGASIEFA